MTSKEIIKSLEKEGFVRKGLRGGTHRKWTHSDGRIVIVPHPKKDFSMKDKYIFPAIFSEETGGFNISFPNLSGACIVTGKQIGRAHV